MPPYSWAVINEQKARTDPLITKRTTLGFSLVGAAANFIWASLTPDNSVSTDSVALLGAVAFGTAVVTLLVAWFSGAVLALRARSPLWLVVSLLPPPVGSTACALWCPQPPGSDQRRTLTS